MFQRCFYLASWDGDVSEPSELAAISQLVTSQASITAGNTLDVHSTIAGNVALKRLAKKGFAQMKLSVQGVNSWQLIRKGEKSIRKIQRIVQPEQFLRTPDNMALKDMSRW